MMLMYKDLNIFLSPQKYFNASEIGLSNVTAKVLVILGKYGQMA